MLHEITRTAREVIVWFSARDIDLTMAGAKAVRPRVLAESDIAEEHRSLIDEPHVDQKGTIRPSPSWRNICAAVHLAQRCLYLTTSRRYAVQSTSSSGSTRISDCQTRPPSRVASVSSRPISRSRYRAWSMRKPRRCLTDRGRAEDRSGLIGAAQREQIIEESNGHPYVIKIILGEIANTRKFGKPSNLIVRKDEILDALFERTYANLSPMASRIFLPLSGWRSPVPQLAVEAVVRRYGSTGGDPELAIDELVRMSLVERARAGTIPTSSAYRSRPPCLDRRSLR